MTFLLYCNYCGDGPYLADSAEFDADGFCPACAAFLSE